MMMVRLTPLREIFRANMASAISKTRDAFVTVCVYSSARLARHCEGGARCEGSVTRHKRRMERVQGTISNTDLGNQMKMENRLVFPKMSARVGVEGGRENCGLKMMLLGRVRKALASTR